MGDRVLGAGDVLKRSAGRGHRRQTKGKIAPRFNALVRRGDLRRCRAGRWTLALCSNLDAQRSLSGGRRKEALLGRCDRSGDCRGVAKTPGSVYAAKSVVLRHVGRADQNRRRRRPGRKNNAAGMGTGASGHEATPVYVPRWGARGPDHAPVFTIEVQVPSGQIGPGRRQASKRAGGTGGRSRRFASNSAYDAISTGQDAAKPRDLPTAAASVKPDRMAAQTGLSIANDNKGRISPP